MGRFLNRWRVADLACAVTPPRFLRRYRQRAAFRRRVRRTGVGVGLLLLAYAFVFAEGGLVPLLFKGLEIRRLGRAVAELERRRAWLEREASLREDDAATLERLARERYGMAYPGERLYRLQEVDPARARRVQRAQRRAQEEGDAAGGDPPAEKARRP